MFAIRVESITRAVCLGVAATIGSLLGSTSAQAEVLLKVGTPEQGGQYATVQAAIDAVPVNNTVRHVIEIMPGTYTARVNVPATKPFITLRGQDPLTTKLTFNETQNSPGNEKYVHASTVVAGKDFIAEGLTFENSFGQGAVALALYADADRLIFNNCRFLGWQDTLRAEKGRHYFFNSYVEGSVDFIYGKGQAYFENSTLHAKRNGYLTAQGRETAAESNGHVFKNSTITGDPSVANGSVFLGRPWQLYSRAVFIDTKMSSIISPAGWSTWSGNNNHLTAYFAEYNSMDLSGNPLDVSQRVNWSKQLTALDAEEFSKTNWLGGTDGWNPVIAPPDLPLQGDYNDDGSVDAADYTVWRDSVGGEVELLNETASPGAVDSLDYDAWKSNFGATVEAASASLGVVPEPAGIVMIFAGVPCSACRRRAFRWN